MMAQQQHTHETKVPRGVLYAAAALLAVSLALTALARQSSGAVPATGMPAVQHLDVRFEDRVGGGVGVLNAQTGAEVTVLEPGTNGFIRGVLRALNRERKLESLPREATFRLALLTNGRMSLEDLATHRRVDLDAFGVTNAAAFRSILVRGTQAADAPPQEGAR